VRTIFSYQDLGPSVSPFLLLDYAAPTEFPATEERLGVGEHPHRGFETVTIVYQGGLEHRDSAGNHGIIGPGDVQWMTAASGVVHEEFHEREFAKRGGVFEVVQLWVNLPAKHKLSAPAYQTLLNRDIPVVNLPEGAGVVRLIAGEFQGGKGPARTFTPIHVWDVRLRAGAHAEFALPDGHTAAVFLLSGGLRLNGSKTLGNAELAVFDRSGAQIAVEAQEESTVLVLGGEPIDEPVVGRGPFVMNTEDEIRQAIRDYQSGGMGHLS
jgi:redox-sensitive bicupin YhaK (pirin superfamily)